MLVVKTYEIRKTIHLILSSVNLIITLILIVLNLLFPHQESIFNILFSSNQYILMGIIFLFQVIFSIFIKFTSEEYPNAYLFDTFSLLIFLSLIGMVISINFLTLIAFFILTSMLVGMIFYFGEFKKEFNLLKTYFLACVLSIILLILAALIYYFNTGTIQIYNIGAIITSDIAGTIVAILLILGMGIACGFFPFYVFHLKLYFQEINFFHLIIYMAFNFITLVSIIRILHAISLLNFITIFISLIFSGTGIVIAIYYIILELYTSQDGFTYSTKKIIGYSIISDSNLVLFLFMIFSLFPESYSGDMLNLLGFLYANLIIIKLLLSYSFLQVANVSYEDNVRFLGNFWKNNKFFGLLLFLSGVLLIFPVSLIFIYFILFYFEVAFLLINSLISLVYIIAISFFIISVLINLLYTSHFFIQVYISKNSSYLEKDSTPKLKYKFVNLIAILLIIFLIGNTIMYVFLPNYYRMLISIF